MKPPCKGCEDRAVGCHGNCERYKQYKAELAAAKAELYGKQQENIMIGDVISRSVKKTRRKYNLNK